MKLRCQKVNYSHDLFELNMKLRCQILIILMIYLNKI